MPIPAVTHAMCSVEVNAVNARIAPNIAAALRQQNPDTDHDPSWITDELVATLIAQAWTQWRTTGQQLDGFPISHSPSWTNAYFS